MITTRQFVKALPHVAAGALFLLIASLCANAGPFLYVANNGNSTVSVIDTATNTITQTITGLNAPNAVAITPDKTRVYVASLGAGIIYVISTDTNSITATIKLLYPTAMVFSPNGTRLYVTQQNVNSLSLIDTATNRVEKSIYGFDAPQGLDITPDGSWLYVANSSFGSNSVAVVNANTLTIQTYIFGFSKPADVAINAAGTYAYVANSSSIGGVSVLYIPTNAVTANMYGFVQPSGTTFIPNKPTAYEANGGYTTVTEFSTATNTVLTTIALYLVPKSMAITADGSRLYVTGGGNGTGGIKLINTSNNTVVDTIMGVNKPEGIVIGPISRRGTYR